MGKNTKINWLKITTATSIFIFAISFLIFNLTHYNGYLSNNKKFIYGNQLYYNLNYSEIFKHEIEEGEIVTSNNVVAINTGKFTGRSPKDKYIVKQKPSQDYIWWGSINQPMTPNVYKKLYNMVIKHMNSSKKIYIFDGYSGASVHSRIKVRFITEIAWQHHFVTNMFIRINNSSMDDFEPDFTIINACKVTNPDWKEDGVNSEIFIAFNLEEKIAIIGGTWYGGEMKKGIFSVMNYILPLKDIMTMHCSANIDAYGNTALFFGLSGTGKTTLSTDPNRYLIGDDEHGWDDQGVFNLEGGCYAKTINLSPNTEPEIFKAIKRDALLENVHINTNKFTNLKEVDYFDTRNTENSRVSYPIYHISNYKQDSQGNHPKHIIFLTADAFGVLPPIARLSTGQAMYHFLSGYTAKVAGTERGIIEPQATFSACFGDPFLPLHPTKYADLFLKKLKKYKTQVYLVNTGWTGGPYGIGQRMSIQTTRSCIDAILNDKINSTNYRKDEIFGIEIPVSIDGIDTKILDPRSSWNDTLEYDKTRIKLASMFIKNYKKYITTGNTDFSMYGPQII